MTDDRKETTPEPFDPQVAQRLIRRLQTRLLTLSDADDDPSPQDIERAAKAISQLVRSLRDAETYLGVQDGEERYGYRPKPETRRQFLIKLKRLVDAGLLDELNV